MTKLSLAAQCMSTILKGGKVDREISVCLLSDESELGNEDLSPSQWKEIDDELKARAEEMVKQRTQKWRPGEEGRAALRSRGIPTFKTISSVVYDHEAVFSYLLGKTPFDYATAMRVLSEIKEREADFQPRTIFDYGSGVGSAIW